MVITALFSGGARAQTQTPFAACTPTMYLAIAAAGGGIQLHSVDTSTNPFTFPTIGSPYTPAYNGIGYHPTNNFIYAPLWNATGDDRHHLIRIDSNGVVRDLGVIAGGGINVAPYNSAIASGVIGTDGFLYIKHNALPGGTPSDVMWRVDVATRTATAINLSQPLFHADFAWHNGLIYTHDHVNDALYTIHPASGDVNLVGTSNVPTAVFGSMISATNGVFGRDNNGAFYRFDTATGAATLISDAPSGAGDGAKCPTTAVTLPADTQITKTDNSETYDRGGQVSYTIVVSNDGPFGVQNALVNDDLPAGITNAVWSCHTPTGGASCGLSGDSGSISNVPVNLPAESSVTFTLTMDVPLSFTGELTNTATVTNPADVPDPDTSNNTASDTDIAAPLLTLEKQVTNDDGGTATTADFTLNAAGPETISGTSGSTAVTNAAVPAGTYTLSEINQPGYIASEYSCVIDGGTPVVGNSLTLANEQVAVCTITNDDTMPTLTLAKNVVNDDVGTATTDDFTLVASGSMTISGVSGDPAVTNVPVEVGTYTLSETTLPDYTASDYSCSVNGGAPFTGNSITLAVGDNAVCTITNDDNEPTDLQITKTNGSETYNPGGQTIYTIVVSNNGPINVTNALVNDSLPAPASSATWTCTAGVGGVCGQANGGNSIVDAPVDLQVGGSVIFTYTVDIPAGTEGELVNTATVTNPPETPDSNLSNNTAADGDIFPLITRDKNLTGEDGLINGVAEPGETLTYTVALQNQETFDVQFDLTDNIDDNTTYVAGSATVDGTAQEPNVAGDPLEWTDVDVPAGTTVLVEYSVLVADPIPDGVTEIRNAATSDCAGFPDACTSTPTPGTAVPSKELTGEDGLVDDVAEPGETLTYTVTLTNPGTVDALHDLPDNIDDNTTYVAGSSMVGGNPQEPDETGDPLQWNDLVVPAGGTLEVVYDVLVADPLPDGVTEIRNAATDDCGANPDACVTTPTPTRAIPSKALTGEDGLVANTAEPGETLTYTVTLTNPSDSGTLHDLIDNIDDNTTYVPGSATVGGTAQEPDTAGDPLEWVDLVVPANGTLEVVYSVTVADPIPDGVTQIRNAATDDCGTNPDACVTTPTPGTAVPSKALTGEDGLVDNAAEPGETLTYTVTLSNSSNSGALHDLLDNIDDNTTYVAGSATVGGSPREPDQTGDPLEWIDLVVPANGTLEVVYSVTVVDPLPDDVKEIRNAATHDCDAFPDACVSTRTPGVAAPSKELTAEDGLEDDVAEPGETLTFTVTLTNETDSGALFDLADNIDDNTDYVAGSATVGGNNQEPDTVGDPLVWNDLVVPASGTLEVVYQVTVADPIPEDVTEIRNVAYEDGTPEPDCSANPGQCVVIDPQEPSLGMVKAGEYEDVDGDGASSPGDLIRYTFTVTNTGNVPIADIVPQDEGPLFGGEPGENDLSDFDPENVTLPPGEEGTFTATYSLGQTDIDNAAGIENGVENSATAIGYVNGTQLTGTPVETEGNASSVLSLPLAASDISVIKIAGLRAIRRGEQVPFTIRVTNNAGSFADGLTVIDTMPPGFRYVEGSATTDGEAVTPVVAGRQVRFEGLSLEGNGERDIRLRLLALSSAGPGEHTNRASAQDVTGRQLGTEATATVEILAEPVFDCGDIIGQVFDDRNGNGYQDHGEPGLPGVRLATVKGWLITTDQHGRFHVACATLPDQRIGSNFIMKLDTRTLPTGYRLTTENPRVVRLTAGKLTKLNFGASIGRVVRLELEDSAFEPGELDLSREWAEGIDQLIEVLAQERSVLRLTYQAEATDTLAMERIRHLRRLIAERWRRRGGGYRLEIETRVEAGQ